MKTLTMLALAALTAAVTDTPAAARDIIPDTCTYTNPILHADYSDPDAIRVGGDYWMTASVQPRARPADPAFGRPGALEDSQCSPAQDES